MYRRIDNTLPAKAELSDTPNRKECGTGEKVKRCSTGEKAKRPGPAHRPGPDIKRRRHDSSSERSTENEQQTKEFTMKSDWGFRLFDKSFASGVVPSRKGFAIFTWDDGDRWFCWPEREFNEVKNNRPKRAGEDSEPEPGDHKVRTGKGAKGSGAKKGSGKGGQGSGAKKGSGAKGSGAKGSGAKGSGTKGKGKAVSPADPKDEAAEEGPKKKSKGTGKQSGPKSKGTGTQSECGKKAAEARKACKTSGAWKVGVSPRPKLGIAGWEVFVNHGSKRLYTKVSSAKEKVGDGSLEATIQHANAHMLALKAAYEKKEEDADHDEETPADRDEDPSAEEPPEDEEPSVEYKEPPEDGQNGDHTEHDDADVGTDVGIDFDGGEASEGCSDFDDEPPAKKRISGKRGADEDK